MKLNYALITLGFLLLAGGAGNADLDPYLPVKDWLTPMLVGLGLFYLGMVRLLKQLGDAK